MNRPRLFSALITTACLLLVLGSATVAKACPSCQQAIGNDASQGDLASGIYYSVLFMMAMPFAIVGTFASLAYRSIKREQRRLDDQTRLADQDVAQPTDSQEYLDG